MRSLILALFLVLLSGCVERGASEPVISGESEVGVVCRHPSGSLVMYRAKGVKGLYGLTKSRSGLWYFRGERMSDGKLVDVVGNDCFVECEVN